MDLYLGRHTLSIPNPFLLGFDIDIAFKAQIRPVDRENNWTKTQAAL